MDEQRPWDRQKGEPNLWYDRSTRFRLMGPTRSLLACVNAERVQKGHKESNYVPGSWRRACEQWRWREGAEAWDAAERARMEAEWRERQDTIRTADYGAGEELRSLAEKVLREGPKFITATRRLVDKGRPRVVDKEGNLLEAGEPGREVVTLALQADIALKAVELASKLERQAAGMAPPKQAVEVMGKNGGPIEVSDARSELAARLAAQAARGAAAGSDTGPAE